MSATLLWALRSPCNLGCQYCYFGTVAEHSATRGQLAYGELSHFGGRDLPAPDALRFARGLRPEVVRRVFVAGGEPLLAATTMPIVEALKGADVEVVLCTNGLPLREGALSERIVELGVDAVSVSLDSHDARSNDRWRPDASGAGWSGVLDGIATLRAARGAAALPLLGIYSVVTRVNIGELVETARFVDQLGLDYLVYQPVSLDADHHLAAELSLEPRHAWELRAAAETLDRLPLKVRLPDKGYLAMLDRAVRDPVERHVAGCFGGHRLFFAQPDGSVWPCPSSLKIDALRDAERRSLRDGDAGEIFTGSAGPEACGCFSVDCVNMWQLMAFDALLAAGRVDRP